VIIEVNSTVGLMIPNEFVNTEVMRALMHGRVVRSVYDDGYKWQLTSEKFILDPITKPLEESADG
jgi:hypothetical protein